MMVSIAMFGLAYMMLAPAFAREVLGLEAGWTGAFLAASGVGNFVVSTALLAFNVKNRTALFVAFSAVFAILLLGLAASPWLAVSFLLMGCFGACVAVLVIAGQTIFPTAVHNHMLGRVMSLWSMTGGLGSMTALPLGMAGDEIGLRWALGAVAVMLLLLTVVIGVVRAPWRLPLTEEGRTS